MSKPSRIAPDSGTAVGSQNYSQSTDAVAIVARLERRLVRLARLLDGRVIVSSTAQSTRAKEVEGAKTFCPSCM